MGKRYLQDILETMGAYVDSLKFAGGSFRLMPREVIKELMDLCHEKSWQNDYVEIFLNKNHFPKLSMEKIGSANWESMIGPKNRLESMLKKLREHRFRITPQRITILKVLVGGIEHPTVERIYEQVKSDFPTTSLATVYKTVTLLKELNEVLELGFPEGSNRYDGNRPYPHPHVICIQCKKIVDPDLSGLADMTSELKEETGFKIINHRLDFFGVCPSCQKKYK
jgi:Fur family peroxide stress response transcriptional regulator